MPRRCPRANGARGVTWKAPTTGPRSGHRQPARAGGMVRQDESHHDRAPEGERGEDEGWGRGGIGRRYGGAARTEPGARDLLQSLREAVTVRASGADYFESVSAR